MERPAPYDVEDDMLTLGFAVRLLMTNLDRELIVERAVESLGDFGRSAHVGLFLLDQEGRLFCAGGMVENAVASRTFPVAPDIKAFERVLRDKTPGYFPLGEMAGIPMPGTGCGADGRQCLCAPLIAANSQPVGAVTFAYDAGFTLPPQLMPPLLLLLTIVAAVLETSRLFQMAVYDGLTGLYIRRYFDLRLTEETNRIKRYGGRLALLILDIDHFKSVNDRYGHQQGDSVLRDVASIIKASVRQALDLPCRYGGEEFTVIMPDTDEAGAAALAERIRQKVENHTVQGPAGPFAVTISGGIACMDREHLASGADVLRLADAALYRAKAEGRNRIEITAA